MLLNGVTLGRALNTSLSDTTKSLQPLSDSFKQTQERQRLLNQALERFGTISTKTASRLNQSLRDLETNQARLAHSQASKDALRSRRSERADDFQSKREQFGVVMKPIIASVTHYAAFEAQLRAISVSHAMSSEQEKWLGRRLRDTSQQVNQTPDALLGSAGQLLNNGMPLEQATDTTAVLGKTATASGAALADLTALATTLDKVFDLKGAKTLEDAFSRMLAGTKQGFSMASMAQYATALAPGFTALGATGNQALGQLVSSLSATKGADTEANTARRLESFMNAVGRTDIADSYRRAGVDYNASLKSYMKGGYSQYDSAVLIGNRFLDSKGSQFQQQWATASKAGNVEAQQSLMQRYGLQEVFRTPEAVNYALTMKQNWSRYQANQQTMNSPAATQTLSNDFARQSETLTARWQHLSHSLLNIALNVGEALVPVLVSLSDILTPILDQLVTWTAANPELVRGIVMAVAGFFAFRMALSGIKLGAITLLSPLQSLWRGILQIQRGWQLFNAGLKTTGVLQGVGAALNWLVGGAGTLGRVLGGVLRNGLMIAGRAVLFLGRFLLLTPWGWIISAIGGLLIVAYHFREEIASFFSDLWKSIPDSVKDFLGIGTKTASIETNDQSVAARVMTPPVLQPVSVSALALQPIESPQSEINAAPTARQRVAQVPAVGGTNGKPVAVNPTERVQVAFSPTIYLNGQKAAPTPEMTKTLTLSMNELEKMLNKLLAQRERRGYA